MSGTGRTAAALAACIAAATSPGQAGDEAAWQTIELIRTKDVAVRLKVKRKASLGDEEWMAIEFQTVGGGRRRVSSASFRSSHELFDAKTGRKSRSGSLASGNTFDLFPHAWKTTPVADIYITPKPHTAVTHPSCYSAALLGMPGPDGWRVKARFHMRLTLGGQEQRSTPAAGVACTFQWLRPDESGMAAARDRLRRLLAAPIARAYHSYILSALLKVPQIARGVGVADLLEGLARRERSLDGRDTIVEHLAEHAAADPKVRQFYVEALVRGDSRACADLAYRGSPIWDKRFVEPMLKMAEAARGESAVPRNVVWALYAHRDRWAGDGKTASRLSAVVLGRFSLLKSKPADLKRARLPAWSWGAELLGRTGDKSAIELLRPFLDDKRRLHEGRVHRAIGTPLTVRACDVAYSAIYRLLGHDALTLRKRRELIGGRYEPAAIKTVHAARDKAIAALKKTLDSPGR